MTGNTGLLTSRCDPFGAESHIQLLGGLYDERHRGAYMWYCKERAVGRYRMVCTGGDYGFRAANDTGLVAAFHCGGGHKGQVMNLCLTHVRDFTVGPPRPGFTRDLKTPVGQVGGTVANEMCPACMWPPEARSLQEVADRLHQEMSLIHIRLQMLGVMSGPMVQQLARLGAAQDQVRARLDELHQTGRIHKCPLRLVEVS